MVCFRSGIVFPVSLASWILTRQVERSSSSLVILFAKCTMNRKVKGLRCSFKSHPLFAGAHFHIGIVLYTAESRIEYVVVQNILSIVGPLLCHTELHSH